MKHLKKEFWELLFNSIDEGFCVIEMIFDEKNKPIDYRFLVINTSFEKQTGLVNAVGKTMRELAPGHEEHWFEIYGKIALTGESIRFENSAEQLHRWYDVYAFRFGDPQNFQVAILFNDITERKRSEETIKSLNKELAYKVDQLEYSNKKLIESEKIKSEFFANVSHELRTPLSLILGPLESILSGRYGNPAEQHQGLLKTIHNNVIRLLQMVNGLLDFSKFEAGKMKVQREATDLAAVIKTIVNDFESMMVAKKIDLVCDIDFKNKVVLMDRYLLERIVFNLLSNAAKFTRQDGRVSVRATLDKEICTIEVKDTGIGIPESAMEDLFQKFTQVEGSSTRRFEGTGLGLAMVKEFSELLGGLASVKSEVGEGSVFTVTLHAPDATGIPADQIFERRVLLPQYQSNSEMGMPLVAHKNGHFKVLVCEDNNELQAYIVSLLDPICEIKTADDGEQALDLVRSWHPDLVLSDVMMPKKDGITVCREVKDNAETSKTSVVLLTAQTHREALMKGWEAKADEYLFKPFHPEELVTRIQSLLSGIKERRRDEVQKEEVQKELEVFNYFSNSLRISLKSIEGHSDTLMQDFGSLLKTEGRQLLESTSEDVRGMRQLTENVLKFYRIRTIEIAKVRLDMDKVVGAVVLELNDRGKNNSNARIELDQLGFSLADPTLIPEVWDSLISNALKYSKHKANPIVTVGAIHNGSDKIYFVRDNGMGFDTQFADKLFGVAKWLQQQEEFTGTAIALELARRIVEKHGGKMWMESKFNEGSTFYFSLP